METDNEEDSLQKLNNEDSLQKLKMKIHYGN